MKEKTMKTKVMDFVENLGRPVRYKEIRDFCINENIRLGKLDPEEVKANPKKYSGYYGQSFTCPYFLGSWQPIGTFVKASKNEPRYLKAVDYGLYELVS